MCGIIGYIGYRDAQPILLNSLKRLEYRGYDSFGIAIDDGHIEIFKDVGVVASTEGKLPSVRGKIGIGHTRWATHGVVNKINAHPHTDCNNKIAVVHNGVVENFQQLRESLVADGHNFISDTDTEVIPHLIEKYFTGDLEYAVNKALEKVTGTYAIIVMAEDCPYLIAAKRGSPLIIGRDDKQNFVASDVTAVLEYTNRVLYIDDNEICTVSRDKVKVCFNKKAIVKKESTIPWTVEETQKSGYAHFMLKEIHEQPKALENTFRGFISAIDPEIHVMSRQSENSNILLLGCGTSYHAALVGEYLFNKLCHMVVRLKTSSEFNSCNMALNKTEVIGITQSGETADTLAALKKARNLGCRTIAITNVPESSVTRVAENVFYTRAGIEIGVAATKTFLAQLLSLYLLAVSYDSLDVRTRQDLINEMRMLPAKVQQVINSERAIASHAQSISNSDNVFFIARGINFAIALEGALKLKEISYIHAEAYSAGELKHGPLALIGPKTPVVAIVPQDDTYSMMLTSIKEIKARNAPILALADESDRTIGQFVDHTIYIPQIDTLFSPFLNTVALQLLAYYVAIERNCSIDRPVNLAKCVTVP